MNLHRPNRSSVPPRLVAVLLSVLVLGGCRGITNSNDRAGEEVKLVLLDSKQLATYSETIAGWEPTDARAVAFGNRYKKILEVMGPTLRPSVTSRNGLKPLVVPLLPVVLPLLAGAAVDFAANQLKEDATKYEAQFTGMTYNSDFWSAWPKGERPEADAVAPWAGFALLRYTDKMPAPETEVTNEAKGKARKPTINEPAFHLVVAFVPAKDDPRFFTIRPLFFQTQSAKAKVVGSKIGTTIDISMDATWIESGPGEKQAARHETVSTASFAVGGHSLKKQTDSPEELGKTYQFRTFLDTDSPGDAPYIAGWFVAPPESMPGNGVGAPATPIKLTVRVTERDESKAKAYVERAALALESNRARIVELAGGGDKAAAPAESADDTPATQPSPTP